MTDRPGIMIYFNMVEPLKRLDHTGKGRLFEAMLDYGQYGEIPDFEDDGMLLMAWDFIHPKLDADARSYRKKVTKNSYSSYCAKEKKNDRVPVDFEEWCIKESIDTTEWRRMESIDTERYPNTTPKVTGEVDRKRNGDVDGEVKGEEDPPQEKSFEDLRREKLAMLTGMR